MTSLARIGNVGARGPLILAGAALGVGGAGLAEGFLFRQILQWHGAVSGRIADPAANLLAGGAANAAALAAVVAGVWLMWRVARDPFVCRSGRVLAGAVMAGAALYMLIEGLLAHQLWGLHSLRPGPDRQLWDLAWLGGGAALGLLGLALVGRPPPAAEPPPVARIAADSARAAKAQGRGVAKQRRREGAASQYSDPPARKAP